MVEERITVPFSLPLPSILWIFFGWEDVFFFETGG